MFKFDRKQIPSSPGVYLFKDIENNIIYIGKAKNLKNRVSNYFTNKHNNSIKTQYLVKNINKIDYMLVDNEIESLLLENKLIKKHKPKYNINLKDNKTYAYIKITYEKIPKIMTTRIIKNDGIYFGPYVDGQLRNEIIRLCVELFKIITPKTYSSKSQLNYQIGLSPAKTKNDINIEEYQKKVKDAINFLKGKNIKKVIKNLEDMMKKEAEKNNFEEALRIKNKIENIHYLKEKQKVDLIKNYDQDIVVLINKNFKTIILCLNISKGVISQKREFKFDYYDDGLFEEFIKMYYSKNTCPNEIIVNRDVEDKTQIEKFLSKFRKSKVKIVKPKRGEKLKLLDFGIKNAKDVLSRGDILEKIKDELKLSKVPNIIECFDMSNFGKEFLVGGMTRWVDEREDKDNYRRFEIKSFKGKNDDYKSIEEVIYRRYLGIKEKREKVSFPDLIIIDGGKGHLRAAIKSLNKLKLDIDIISIAKGEKRDKNEIYLEKKNEPLIFDENTEMMLFLRKVRDSVHNYVIMYNRKKRQMKFKEDTK